MRASDGRKRRNSYRRFGGYTALALSACGVFPRGASAVAYTAADTFDLHPSSDSFTLAYGVAGIQQAGWGLTSSSQVHAFLWTGSASSVVDLNPSNLTGYTNSEVFWTTGTQEVGLAYGTATSNNAHAMRWSGTANTAVDLHPTNLTGFTSSQALSTNGTNQVGSGSGTATGNNDHALLWTGAANTAVDLNPTNLSGFSDSLAYAISATQEVGYGFGTATGGNNHALLWSGAANTAVDLNPTNLSGFSISSARGIAGNQQVGGGSGSATPNGPHALLWFGAANTAVDLQPTNLSGFTSSGAIATNGVNQVGYAMTANNPTSLPHAVVWSGTASSAVDLSGLVQGQLNGSKALAIDAYGNISGYANIGTINGGNSHAIVWLAGNLYKVTNVSTGGTGTWTTSANWTAGVPTTGNDVLLIQSDGANRTINYSSPTSVTLGTLTVDSTNGGQMLLGELSGTLGATTENIGFVGAGIMNQVGGINNVSGALVLGAKAGSTGTYNLSGTVNLNAGSIQMSTGSVFQQFSGSVTAGALINNGSYALASGTGAFGAVSGAGTLGVTGAGTATSVVQSSLMVNGSLTIAANGGNSGLTVVSGLTLGTNGKLDLNDNDMIVKYSGTSPAASIQSLLMKGYNGGAWTGAGITSTSAKNVAASPVAAKTALGYAEAADVGIASFDGASISGNAVIVKYTYAGDNSLDGKVDLGNDFNLFLQGFIGHKTGWVYGDYNYDNSVTAADFGMFIDGYAANGALLGDLEGAVAGNSLLTVAQKSQFLAVVPEPGTAVGAETLLMVVAMRRRRARK